MMVVSTSYRLAKLPLLEGAGASLHRGRAHPFRILVQEFRRDPSALRRIEAYGYPTLEQLSRVQEYAGFGRAEWRI